MWVWISDDAPGDDCDVECGCDCDDASGNDCDVECGCALWWCLWWWLWWLYVGVIVMMPLVMVVMLNVWRDCDDVSGHDCDVKCGCDCDDASGDDCDVGCGCVSDDASGDDCKWLSSWLWCFYSSPTIAASLCLFVGGFFVAGVLGCQVGQEEIMVQKSKADSTLSTSQPVP